MRKGLFLGVGLASLGLCLVGCTSGDPQPSPVPSANLEVPTATSAPAVPSPAQTPTRGPRPIGGEPAPDDAVLADPLPLGIANNTTLGVSLVINDQLIRVFPPGQGDQDIDASLLPSPPWHVEARSPTGRVLLEMDVDVGDVWRSEGPPGGPSTVVGRAVRADLSCGRLDVWSGPPMDGPMPPDSFPAGDCDS